MDTRLQIGALQRAEGIVGGRTQLRRYLNVPAMCLALWMSGADAAPPDVFLKVVDLIVDREITDLGAPR